MPQKLFRPPLLSIIFCLALVGLPLVSASPASSLDPRDRKNLSAWKVTVSDQCPERDPSCYVVHPPGQGVEDRLVVAVEDVLEKVARCREFRGTIPTPGAGKGKDDGYRFHLLPREFLSLGDESRRLRKGPDNALVITLSGEGLIDELRKRPAWLVDQILEGSITQEALSCRMNGIRQVLLQAVAQALPRTFEEVQKGQGLFADKRAADLRPGMRLCVESTETLNHGNKFYRRPGSPRCYTIGRIRPGGDFMKPGSWDLGFHALLERLEGFQVNSGYMVDGSDQPIFGVAKHTTSAVDMVHRDRQAFRIYYPKIFDPLQCRMPGKDDELLHLLPVLVGAREGDLERLDRCLKSNDLEYLCDKKVEGCPSGRDELSCHIFTEDGVPTPEIQVRVQHETLWVPLGTPLIDVLDRYFELDVEALFAHDAASTVHRRAWRILNGLRFHRLFHDRSVPIKFDERVGLGALYLPLAKGDEISW